MVFALAVIGTVRIPNIQRWLAALALLAFIPNAAVMSYEADRTAKTENHVANRIIMQMEALPDFNPHRTNVGVIGNLNLWYFGRNRRSFGGGLSPRITKASYSALSEVAGYELRRPRATQSRRMKAYCDEREAETQRGIYYLVETFENSVLVCFLNPRNQPR